MNKNILKRFKMNKLDSEDLNNMNIDVVLDVSEKMGECEGYEVYLSEDNYVLLIKDNEYWLSCVDWDDEDVLEYIN